MRQSRGLAYFAGRATSTCRCPCFQGEGCLRRIGSGNVSIPAPGARNARCLQAREMGELRPPPSQGQRDGSRPYRSCRGSQQRPSLSSPCSAARGPADVITRPKQFRHAGYICDPCKAAQRQADVNTFFVPPPRGGLSFAAELGDTRTVRRISCWIIGYGYAGRGCQGPANGCVGS